MARTWKLLFELSLMCSCLVFVGEVKGMEKWNENKPTISMAYQVYIEPRKEDCYFQYAYPGATFYVLYEVSKGGDGMCGFTVRGPNGEVVHPYEWKASSEYSNENSPGGYFSICIDNQSSSFARKTVNMYITTVRYDLWEIQSKELEEMQINSENFTRVITTVEKNVHEVQKYQFHSRSREAIDYNLVSENNTYIVRWSLVQIAVIAAATMLQVIFVKKLFDVKGTGRRPGI